MFLPLCFSIFFFYCDNLSFINTQQKTWKNLPPKNVSMPRMDEKKLHTREFQLKGSSWNMRCKLLQKRFTGKTTKCSKHLHHIAIEKDILSELTRCVFQISLKHIKLVIPKILFILVLCSFNFYFKIMWPTPNKITLPHQNKNFWHLPAKTFLKFSKLEGRGCMPCIIW